MSILLLSTLVYPSCFAAALQAKWQHDSRAEQRAQHSSAQQSMLALKEMLDEYQQRESVVFAVVGCSTADYC